MTTGFLRLLVSPAPAVSVVDAVVDALGRTGTPLPACVDLDMDCVIWNVALTAGAYVAVADAAGALQGCAPGSLFVFELQDADMTSVDTTRLGASLGDALDAPVYVATRAVPASEWVAGRPISFGLDGLAVRAPAATLPRTGSRNRGVALEFGAPTVLLKATLHGVPGDALSGICRATGNAQGGLLHIGAYPGISARSGEPFVVLECSDPAKSPPARALDIVGIECARYGGRLGQCMALSHISLHALLDTLAQGMRLDAQIGQVIETHLGPPAKR